MEGGIDKSYIVHDDDFVKGFDGKYRFLSNFYPATVYFEGIKYPTSEHAYQAAKVLDSGTRSTMFLNCSAAQAKKNGRIVTVRSDWSRVKFDVMSVILFEKFYRNEDLREDLLFTGKRYLEETNHWNDTYWGVCNGKGDNNLGVALMGIRTYWATKYPDMLGRKRPTINALF